MSNQESDTSRLQPSQEIGHSTLEESTPSSQLDHIKNVQDILPSKEREEPGNLDQPEVTGQAEHLEQRERTEQHPEEHQEQHAEQVQESEIQLESQPEPEALKKADVDGSTDQDQQILETTADKPSSIPHTSVEENHKDSSTNNQPVTMDDIERIFHETVHETNYETRKRSIDQTRIPANENDPNKRIRNNQGNQDLDLEFEKAIQEHSETKPDDHHKHNDIIVNEKEDLQMIANQLEQATTSKKPDIEDGNNEDGDEDLSDPKNNSQGHAIQSNEHDKSETEIDNSKTRHSYIPADSELFKTNAAFVAYNELSSQLPPLAALSNAQLTLLPLPIVAPDYLPPRIQLLINTLPTLDNLATQLLRIVAIGPYQKIIDLASNPSTPAGATYRDLTSLFEFTKKLYNEEDPFLTVEHIAPGMWKEGDKTPEMFRNREQSIESTLRKVNLATFLAATLGTIEVGFFYLNESFLDVFCPTNNLDPDNALSNMAYNNSSLQSMNATIGETVGKLLKPQAVLYLDLKTQAYISAIEAGERSNEEILEDIFPSDLETYLQARRNTKSLSPVELDFIDRCKIRKQTLLNYSPDRNLGEEYEWFTYLNNLFDYVGKNMGFLIWGKKGRGNFKFTTTGSNYKVPTGGFSPNPTSLSKSNEKSNKDNAPHSAEMLDSTKNQDKIDNDHIDTTNKILEIDDKDPNRNRQIKDLTSALLPSEIQEQQIHIRINPSTNVKSLHRRPWSREEEKALRHALELKGPAWSVILELFGAGGKISEALKNRTQVQLKDKARNWKMFFLKSGLPVPTYLQKVTGDLERDDRLRARINRSKKTAAAPVPNPARKGKNKNANDTEMLEAISDKNKESDLNNTVNSTTDVSTATGH